MRRLRRRGFTLIEVVVVITLLAIVAAVTVPALGRLEPADDRDRAVRDLMRLLRSARATALDRGSATTLLLDPGRQAWWLDLDSAGTTIRVIEGSLSFPEGVKVSGDQPRLAFRFYANGRSMADSFFVSSRAGGARIRVDPWNGEPDAQ